ncbi:hypothetical protein [Paenibacillus herberti]|uniref:CBM56 domain-containing protein n=1 Tax=Paenibacillus herberti TaxID=1619309 RepID=A0A229NU82_9BACL|nr:hypothetical protein [Paenibacillus herberti]OXM13408.1 hypothetical protein CGZ75_20340 [Paenibacillus herberti]
MNINWLSFAAAGGGTLTYTTADYTATVTKNGTSETITFTPTTAAQYVDLHYLVNGAEQQNFRMTKSGASWTYKIPNLTTGQSLEIWFTYEKGGPQYDSPHYTYTH